MAKTTKATKATKAETVTPKAESNGQATKAPRPRIEGLRKPQVRILEALAAAQSGRLSRKQLLEAKVVDPAWLYVHLGQEAADRNDHNEAKWGVKSLATWGYVTFKVLKNDENESLLATITPAGKKALAAYHKANA